jgi:hypothetical protein
MGLFVVACAQDKTPPPSDDELSSSPPDAAVLRSYVEALAEGDVDSAMELRCRNARQEGDAQVQFGAELERLTDALGAPKLVRVSESDPPTGVGAWVEGGDDDPEQRWREELDAVELRYWLSFGGVEFDDPQYAVVLDEGGERRICGHATHAADRLFDVIDDDISDTGLPSVRQLSDLMPATVGDNYQQVEDRAHTPEDLPGAVEAYTRAWQEAGEHAGARVSAFRFTSPDVALAWAGHRARTEAGDSVRRSGAQGCSRCAGQCIILAAHTTNRRSTLPRPVIFLAGNVGVEIAVTQSGTDADTGMAVDISHQVADLARS